MGGVGFDTRNFAYAKGISMDEIYRIIDVYVHKIDVK
jgi:hypothetical protein